MVHKADSQVSLVLEHLTSGKEITPLEALTKYGCFRLGAVIFKLKKEGYKITTERREISKANGNKGRFAVYRMEANNGSV